MILIIFALAHFTPVECTLILQVQYYTTVTSVFYEETENIHSFYSHVHDAQFPK